MQKEGYPFVLSSSTASQTEKNLDYLVLRKIYPTIISGDSPLFKGSIQQGSQQLYLSQIDSRTIYPVTVGTIANMDNNPLYPVKQKIKLLLKVPSSIIGIQYPAYFNASYVEELAVYLSEHPQIELLNLRQTKQQVTSKNISIKQHENGEQTIQLAFTKIERLKILFEERPVELILWALILIVSLFVTLFLLAPCVYVLPYVRDYLRRGKQMANTLFLYHFSSFGSCCFTICFNGGWLFTLPYF